MTDLQFLLLLGTVWFAPNCNPNFGYLIGASFLIVASIKGLGWL